MSKIGTGAAVVLASLFASVAGGTLAMQAISLAETGHFYNGTMQPAEKWSPELVAGVSAGFAGFAIGRRKSAHSPQI